jgi:hypothetical protein
MRRTCAWPRNVAAALFGFTVLLAGCTDQPDESVLGPTIQAQLGPANQGDIQRALIAQQRHSAALMRIPGVVGTAVGYCPMAEPPSGSFSRARRRHNCLPRSMVCPRR